MSHERPYLHCRECGADLIPADGRGRADANGNEVWHRDTCRCRWCDWWWTESDAVFTCARGAVSKVFCEDGTAFAVKVKAPSAPEKE